MGKWPTFHVIYSDSQDGSVVMATACKYVGRMFESHWVDSNSDLCLWGRHSNILALTYSVDRDIKHVIYIVHFMDTQQWHLTLYSLTRDGLQNDNHISQDSMPSLPCNGIKGYFSDLTQTIWCQMWKRTFHDWPDNIWLRNSGPNHHSDCSI